MVTFRTDPLSHASLQDRWAAMLGTPRKEVSLDVKAPLPIITETLAAAYTGQNIVLSNRIEHHMTYVDSWAIRIVAPVLATDQVTATFSRTTFVAEIMPEVSPEGVPRCLTYTRESVTTQTERRGLGIYVELGWAETAEGISMLANQIAQISASMVETARIDVLVTLMNAQDHYNAWNRNHGIMGGPGDHETALARDINFWCCAQILENGLERLDEQIKGDVSVMAGARPLDTFILPGNVGSYVRVVPVASVQHWVGGNLAMERINGMLRSEADSMIPTGYSEDNSTPLFMNASAGNMVFLTRPVITHPDGAIDPMERYAQLGEYFDMLLDPRSVNEHYTSQARDVKAYNETADDWEVFTQEWAIRNSGMWDAETGRLFPFSGMVGGNNFGRFRDFSGYRDDDSIADNQIWFGKRSPGTNSWVPIGSWGDVRSLKPAHIQAVGRSVLNSLARASGGSAASVIGDYDGALSYLRSLHDNSFDDIAGNDGRMMGGLPSRLQAGTGVQEYAGGAATFRAAVNPAVRENYRQHGLLGFLARPRADMGTATQFTTRYLGAGGEDVSLRPYIEGLNFAHDQSYLGPLPLRTVIDPFKGGAGLKEQYNVEGHRGGTASMAYLRWARQYADDEERKRANAAIRVIERLASFLTGLFPDSHVLRPTSATPYVDMSAEQALIELILGDVRYVGFILVASAHEAGSGAGYGPFSQAGQRNRAIDAMFLDPEVRTVLKGDPWAAALGGSADNELFGGRQTSALRVLGAMFALYSKQKTAAEQDAEGDFRRLLQDVVFASSFVALFAEPGASALSGAQAREHSNAVLSRYETVYAPSFTARGTATGSDIFAWNGIRARIQAQLEALRDESALTTPASMPSGVDGVATEFVSYTKVTWPGNQDRRPIYSHWGTSVSDTGVVREVGVWLVPTAAGNPALLDTSALATANNVVNHTFIDQLRAAEAWVVSGPDARIYADGALSIRGQMGHVKSLGGGEGETHLLPPGVHGLGVIRGEDGMSPSTAFTNRLQESTVVRTSRLIGAGVAAWHASPGALHEHLERVRSAPPAMVDHVAAMEGSRTLDTMLGAIFLSVPITRDSMLAMDTANVFIPWQPILARPFATYTTYSALKVRAGMTDIVTGGQPAIVYLSGPTSVVMGVDANTQTMRGTVIAYGKTMVAEPRCVYHARNVACKDAHGGLCAQAIDPDGWQPVSHQVGITGSVIVIPEGPEFRGFEGGRFDITGDYFNLYKNYGIELLSKTPYGPPSTRRAGSQGNVQYPLAPWIVERYSLDRIVTNVQSDWAGPFVTFGPNVASNTICYRGTTYRRDRDGHWSEMTQGTGHWGPAQGPGNLGVRKGMLKRATHHGFNRPGGDGSSGAGSFLNGS